MTELPARYEREAVALMPMAADELVAVSPPAPGSITVNDHGMATFDPDPSGGFAPMGVRVRVSDVVRVDGVTFRDDVELDEG